MRQYDQGTMDDKIRRTKERRALIWRMEEEERERDEQQKVQAKSSLEIGASDDPLEQHADAVAQKVVSGGDASGLLKNQPSATTSVQTKEEPGMLMAKSESGSLTGTEQLQSTLNSSKGGGQSLDVNTRQDLGQKMGADLSDVKIHTDTKAHEMSEGINAKAFTHGQDIYFKQGNFNTSSTEGKELLAHELTHTQQQEGAIRRTPDPSYPDWVNEAILYNQKKIKTTELRDRLIWQMFKISGNEVQRNDALADPGFADGFVYLVKSTQRVTMPSGKTDDIMSAYNPNHDGKLGPATYKSMMTKLRSLQNTDDKAFLETLQEGKEEKDKEIYYEKKNFSKAELDGTYYNVFVLGINVNGASEQKAMDFYKSGEAAKVKQSYTPEADFTRIIGIIQSILFGSGYGEFGHFNSETKTAIDKELAKPQLERKIITYTIVPVKYDKRYQDMPQPPELNITFKLSEDELKKQKEQNRKQDLKDRAPYWLHSELNAIVKKVNIDTAVKLLKQGKPVNAPVTYAGTLTNYKQTSGKEGIPVERLRKESSYSQEKGKYATVSSDKEADEMITLLFSAMVEQRASEKWQEEKRLKNKQKLENETVMTQSGPTGYAYYTATYAKLQNEMMTTYSEEVKTKYSKKTKDEIATKQRQLETLYQGYLNDYIAEITPVYEQRKIDVLKTGDPEVDKNIAYELQLANEHGFALPPAVQAIEDEKQEAIQKKAALLNEQFMSEMAFEQSDIEKRNMQLQQQDMLAFGKSLDKPFILPQYLLDSAYESIEARINKKEKEEESSSYNSLNRMFEIDIEWLQREMEIRNLLKIPYEPYVNTTRRIRYDENGMGMIEPDFFQSREETDRINKQWADYYAGQTRLENAKVEFYNYILSKEMIDQEGDDKGRPSIYAIKAWAYEWSDWVDKRITYWSNKHDNDYSMFSPMTLENIQTMVILKNYKLAQQKLWEIRIHPENDHGSFWNDFGDGLASVNIQYMIPFIGAIIEISDLWQVKAIAEKQKKGIPLHESEVILLESYAAINDINSRVQTSGYSIGQGVAMAIPFIVEFVATMGVGAIAEQAFTRGTAWMLKKVATNTLKAETKMLIVKTIGATAKTVFHTIANPQQYLRKTVQNMMPQTLVMMDNGELRFLASDEDSMGFWEAFKDGGIHTLIDFWTEHLGGWLTKQGSSVINRIFLANPRLRNNIIANWLVKKGIIKPSRLNGTFDGISPLVRKNPLFRSVLADFGFGNIPEEYFEEFIANQLHQVADGKPIKIDGGQELDTLIMVLLISGPMQLAGGVSRVVNNFSDVSGNQVRLEGNTTRNGVVEHTSYSFDRSFIESLDDLSSTEGINTKAAGKLIDDYLMPLHEKANISAEEMAEQKRFLLNYHISSQVDTALTAWAFVDMAGGNFTESHALIKAAKGLPLTATDLATIAEIEGFESFAGVIQALQNNGADANTQSYVQQRLVGPGTDAAFRQGFSAYLTGSVVQMNSPITGEDIDAEFALYEEYKMLNPAQQNAFVHFRIKGEGGVSFKTRVDMIPAKGFTVAQYMDELIRLGEIISTTPVASEFKTPDEFVADAKAHADQLGSSAILKDTKISMLQEMQLMNDLHLEIASRMSMQLQTIAGQEAEASGKKRLQRVQNRRMDKFFSALADPAMTVEEKKKVMNRHLHRLQKMYGRHIEGSKVDFEGMQTLIDGLNEQNFGNRYMIDENGNVMINGNAVPLDTLKADVEKANAEMAFNNINVRYRLKVEETFEKKRVIREVTITSTGIEEFEETKGEEKIFKRTDKFGVIIIFKGYRKFKIEDGAYYEWDGVDWNELNIDQKEFEYVIGEQLENVSEKIPQAVPPVHDAPQPDGKYFPHDVKNGKIEFKNRKYTDGWFDFVITTDNQLMIGKGHFFLAQEKNVLAAGRIKLENGRLRYLDNLSGHYQLSQELMISNDVKGLFESFRINVNGCKFYYAKFDKFENIIGWVDETGKEIPPPPYEF